MNLFKNTTTNSNRSDNGQIRVEFYTRSDLTKFSIIGTFVATGILGGIIFGASATSLLSWLRR